MRGLWLTLSNSVVTVGVSLTIPLALIGSAILPGTNLQTVTIMSLLGAGLVILGFCMLGWQGWEDSKAMVRADDGRAMEQDMLSSTAEDDLAEG